MMQQYVNVSPDSAMMQQYVNVSPDSAMMQQSHDEKKLWKIKKLLQDNDLNKRLLVTMNMAKKFLLPVLGTPHDTIEEGIVVAIWDVDTRTQHSLLLQKWSKSYVLTGDWNRDFVKRRSLKRHDMVGLYWDPSNNRFNFSVLPPEEYIVHIKPLILALSENNQYSYNLH
ncbi:putative B3 domain-containing protein, partial [Mucuna pruriens]